MLRDLLSLVTSVMIPAGVIASWTEQERQQAEQWAAAGHLRASDNFGVKQRPKPACVRLAEELAANPAMAQLAVEGWGAYLTQLQDSQRYIGAAEAVSIDTARRAVTGLLILLGDSRTAPGWQARAKEILADHREGVRAIDLFALLGRTVPAKEEFSGWLTAGETAGILEETVPGTWRLRGPGR